MLFNLYQKDLQRSYKSPSVQAGSSYDYFDRSWAGIYFRSLYKANKNVMSQEILLTEIEGERSPYFREPKI
jgi:hypothetical protein